MPVDNNTPRGNHFAAGGPRQSGSSSNPSGTNRGTAPDTTDAFMMASRSGKRTARPTAAQPIAGYSGGGVNTGARNSYQQQRNVYASTNSNSPNSTYDSTRSGGASNAYSSNNGPKKGKVIGLVAGLVVLAIVAFGGTTGFFL